MSAESIALSRVMAVNGSPHAEKGFTDMVVRRFLAGAEAAGAEVDVAYPARMKIAPCVGCLTCWFKTPHVCRHKDDMPGLIERVLRSPLHVYATPVYVDNMTSQMKKFFDRMCSVADPFMESDGKRHYHPRVGSRGPGLVIISTCGFPEREHFLAVDMSFERIARNMHAEIIGKFYFPASSLFIMEPDLVKSQLEAVERAGREAVESGVISGDAIEAANSDYVGDPIAVGERLNEFFHQLRRRGGAE